MILDLEDTLNVGTDSFFDSSSAISSFAVIFEDDLRTGYFYAIDRNTDMTILDAVHIYNVEDVIDKDKPSNIQIAWTDDWQMVSLLINNYCHAIFDFKNKAGYCRTAFPESNGEWSGATNSRELTDDLISALLTGR